MLKLINKYSSAELPKNLEPKVLVRYVAVSSGKVQAGNEIVAEWTAPTTPIILLYKDWPGQTVEPQYLRIIGSIGDLRLWIKSSKDGFRFLVQHIIIAVLSIMIAVAAWIVDRPTKPSSPDPFC